MWQVELKLEQKVLFSLLGDRLLSYLEDRVKVPEALWELILLEILWDEYFKTLLELNDEKLLGDLDSLKQSFYIEMASERPDALK